MEAGIFLVIGAIVLFWWFVSRARAQEADEEWRQAARKLRLGYRPRKLLEERAVHGRLDGYRVHVERVDRGDGETTDHHTLYRVTYPRPLGLGLRISKEKLLTGLWTALGAQDIEVGDPEFDRSLLVKGANPAKVRAHLTPARRFRILRALKAWDRLVIEDASVAPEMRGTARGDDIVRCLPRAVALARCLAEDRPADRSLSRAVEARRAGDLAAALEQAEEAVAREEAPAADARVQTAEVLALSNRHADAEEILRPVRAEVPEVDLPEGSPELETAPPPEREEASDAPGAEEIAADLFLGDRTGLEVGRRFGERYAGRRVRWSGVLRRVESYSADPVLGRTPGTRAVVVLCEIEAGVLGTRKVQAVIGLGPGARDALRDRIGREVAFAGRLLKADYLARNLYVGGAALLTP